MDMASESATRCFRLDLGLVEYGNCWRWSKALSDAVPETVEDPSSLAPLSRGMKEGGLPTDDTHV